MLYQNCRPIEETCSAWLINFIDKKYRGKRILSLFPSSTHTKEIDVIEFTKNDYPDSQFTVMQIDAGNFDLQI